jgi:signal peptidase II
MARFHRKRQLVKSRLQLKLILSLMGVACLATLFQIILVNRALSELGAQLPREGDLLLQAIPSLIRSSVVLTLAFLVPFMMGVGLVLTHRIAGPIYRFEQYLKSVAAGEHTGPCKIRQGDELQELCDVINEAVAALENRRAEDAPDASEREAA